MKKIVIFVLVAIMILMAAGSAGMIFLRSIVEPLDKTGMEWIFNVYCDEERFVPTRTDYRFVPDYDVFLIFPMNSTEVDYSFEIDGVDAFDANYYEGVGYLIRFVMPARNVTVDFEEKDSAEALKTDSEEVHISLEENPTTGFVWEYEIEPEGILEVLEDQYVNDPSDPKNPECGGGGRHFWRFRTVGEGIAKITFTLRRGDELAGKEVTYSYECDATTAVRMEE